MKTLDVKSLLIGALFASTIFLGVAATSPTDKWDDKQEWSIKPAALMTTTYTGYEPFAWHANQSVMWRKRIK